MQRPSALHTLNEVEVVQKEVQRHAEPGELMRHRRNNVIEHSRPRCEQPSMTVASKPVNALIDTLD